MKPTLIPEWRHAWRYASNWYAAVAVSLLTWWNMMPPRLHRMVPDWADILIGLVLWLGYYYARIIEQPKTRAKIAAKMEARNGSV